MRNHLFHFCQQYFMAAEHKSNVKKKTYHSFPPPIFFLGGASLFSNCVFAAKHCFFQKHNRKKNYLSLPQKTEKLSFRQVELLVKAQKFLLLVRRRAKAPRTVGHTTMSSVYQTKDFASMAFSWKDSSASLQCCYNDNVYVFCSFNANCAQIKNASLCAIWYVQNRLDAHDLSNRTVKQLMTVSSP